MAGHSAAAEPYREQKASAPCKWQLPDDSRAELGRKRSRPLDSNDDQFAYHRKRHERPIFIAAKLYDAQVGRLLIKVSRSRDGKQFHISFTFTPYEGMLQVCRTGFVATLRRASHQFSVGRYLSTFTAVEWKGSGFETIHSGDLQELQRLFMAGEASPFDRLAEDNNTLIGVSSFNNHLIIVAYSKHSTLPILVN